MDPLNYAAVVICLPPWRSCHRAPCALSFRAVITSFVMSIGSLYFLLTFYRFLLYQCSYSSLDSTGLAFEWLMWFSAQQVEWSDFCLSWGFFGVGGGGWNEYSFYPLSVVMRPACPPQQTSPPSTAGCPGWIPPTLGWMVASSVPALSHSALS